MRLQDRTLNFVVNFLLGASWAVVLIGGTSVFFSFYQEDFLFAFVAALFAALPGLTAVVLIEHIITSKEKYQELQKQTKLLQKILELQEKSSTKIDD